MNTAEANAVPSPAPDGAANTTAITLAPGTPATPTLTVVPPPGAASAPSSEPKTEPKSKAKPVRQRSVFHQAQLEEIDLAEHVGGAAQNPDYATRLKERKITPAFTSTLLTDTGGLRALSSAVVGSEVDAKPATAQGVACEQKLVGALRQAQTAARQEFKQSDPLHLEKYLIGEDITANRNTLVQSSQTIISQTDADRPAGIGTEFVQKATAARAEFVDCKPAQATEQSDAGKERAERDAKVEAVKQRRQQIQFAVEFLWPSGVPGNEAVRRLFRLPVDRPYLG